MASVLASWAEALHRHAILGKGRLTQGEENA